MTTIPKMFERQRVPIEDIPHDKPAKERSDFVTFGSVLRRRCAPKLDPEAAEKVAAWLEGISFDLGTPRRPDSGGRALLGAATVAMRRGVLRGLARELRAAAAE